MWGTILLSRDMIMRRHCGKPSVGFDGKEAVVLEVLVLSASLLLAAVVRHLPAIIWSLRCPRDAAHYRCPRLHGDRSAVPDLLPGRPG